MKTTRWAAAVALLAAPIAACLPTPIGKPGSAPIDARVLGTWTCTSTEEETEEARLEVLQFDAGQYLAEWTEGEKTTRYRAFPATVRGQTLINVDELGDRGEYAHLWAVLRYRRDGSALAIDGLDQKVLDTDDDKAVRRAVETRPADPSLWKRFADCVVEGRPGPSPIP